MENTPLEKNQNYNQDQETETKPVYREIENCKYQIFKDYIQFVFEDKQLPISISALKRIINKYDSYIKGGYYTGQCISCHKFDAIVNGFCKPCFDENNMEYEDVAK